ncbi:MAG TPA: YraN family protein [Longimicrobiales bacterium]|nr:YraN family protein [Longimicrobiales bacterium]
MSGSHRLGAAGESLAAAYLAARGYRILERNVRSGRAEVDLIVRRGRTVAFVEVKTRAGPDYGHPLEAITRAKRREIERVAAAWVRNSGAPGDAYRFDAVAITWDGRGEPAIEHVPDAWRR